MNFLPEHIRWILDKSPHTGKPKTATRRLVQPDRQYAAVRIGGELTQVQIGGNEADLATRAIERVLDNDRLKWMVGNDYAICPGRGRPQVARFTLAALRYDQLVEDISPKEAAEEGFASPDAFIDAWRTIYGKGAEAWDAWVLKWRDVWRVSWCVYCGRVATVGSLCKYCRVPVHERCMKCGLLPGVGHLCE